MKTCPAASRRWLGVAARRLMGALAGAWLVGCSSVPGGTQDGPSGPPASAVQHPTLEGIPLPNGFSLVDDRSAGTVSGKFRVVKFEFVGETDRAAVNRFYRNYMPSGGWTLKQERFNQGQYDLRFESETEECNVLIKPNRFNKTTVVIDVGPRPAGSAERESRPPAPRP